MGKKSEKEKGQMKKALTNQLKDNKDVIKKNEDTLQLMQEGIEINQFMLTHAKEKEQYIQNNPIKVINPVNSYEQDPEWSRITWEGMKFSSQRETKNIEQMLVELKHKISKLKEQNQRITEENKKYEEMIQKQ